MECPTTPVSKLTGLGFFPFARRYLGNRYCFLFLRVLRCFSSPGLPQQSYEFRLLYHSIKNGGLPHSEILGSMSTYDSPRHIGVSPVLRRLLVPRHPPCALIHLTSKRWITLKKLKSFYAFDWCRWYFLFGFQGTINFYSHIEVTRVLHSQNWTEQPSMFPYNLAQNAYRLACFCLLPTISQHRFTTFRVFPLSRQENVQPVRR